MLCCAVTVHPVSHACAQLPHAQPAASCTPHKCLPTTGKQATALPPFSGRPRRRRVMVHAGIRRQRLGAARDAPQRALLDEFAAGAGALRFSPPLAPGEAALLRELQGGASGGARRGA